MYSRELKAYVHTKIYVQMFTVALFITAKKWAQPRGSPNYGISTPTWKRLMIIQPSQSWSTEACYNLDEPWNHYATWKKSDTKDILHDSFSMKYLQQQIQRDRKQTGDCQGTGRGWRMWWKSFAARAAVATQRCEGPKCHWSVHCKIRM